jgi:hypothetical protein
LFSSVIALLKLPLQVDAPNQQPWAHRTLGLELEISVVVKAKDRMSFQDFQNNYARFIQNSSTQQEGLSEETVHRGLINSKFSYMSFHVAQAYRSSVSGVVLHSCSDDFMIVLCLEFWKAQSHQLMRSLRKFDQREQDQRLKFLAHEIQRLLRHPQLFPSESSRIRFFAFLAVDSRFQLCEAVSGLLMQNEIQDLQETWRKNVSRKGYLEGTRGWENFLLFDAPGLRLSSDRTVPESMVQAMPPVAARIVADFEREEREIVRFVEQVR